MTEEQKEQFLREQGWWKGSHHLWNHNKCPYACCLEVAVMLQKGRNEWAALPWYTKLFRKIFE